MKKLISMIVVLAMLVILLPVMPVSSSEAEESGICGDDLVWEFNEYTLTISGNGAMYDYSEAEPAPWIGISHLLYIIIEDGVTSIGDYAFAECNQVRGIILPYSVESIGEKAFQNIKRYSAEIVFRGLAPEIAEDAFAGSILRISTIFQWDQTQMQTYGGNAINWYCAKVGILNSTSKLWGLNWQFKPEDFKFSVASGVPYGKANTYLPQQVEFGPYDNSTYGQKSVEVTIDGHPVTFDYFVTDGKNHLDLIEVRFAELPEYHGRENVLKPIVTIGTMELRASEHYELIYNNKITSAGMDGQFTIKGWGICEGFEKTFYYPVLKADLSAGDTSYLGDCEYLATPMTPRVSAHLNGADIRESRDYCIFYEDNVNIGLATVRAVGLGDCYGEVRGGFRIEATETYPTLQGSYLGKIGEDLSDNYKITEMMLSPAKISTRIGSSEKHIAQYALYRLVGEDFVLIEEKQSDVGYKSDTKYEYDFSHVYEDAADEGGAVYMLVFSWVTASSEVYGGALVMGIPAKVLDATSMTMYYVEGDGDFRKEFLSVSGDNGPLGEVAWTSSDPSVATVEKGVISLHTPGSAVITAQYGGMVRTHTVISPQLDLTSGIIFDYNAETGARVIWDDRLLEEGTDYTLSVSKNGDGITVTATGCGLFAGELEKTFDGIDSLADRHTHSFTNRCDGTCNGCDYTRGNDHTWAENWSKDQQSHWHACTVCGEKEDEAAHTISPDDDEECLICGKLWIPGDTDGNGKIDNKDVEYLLWYTLFPEDYPLLSNSDFDESGIVDNKDVEYLLWYTLFPEDYPLH